MKYTFVIFFFLGIACTAPQQDSDDSSNNQPKTNTTTKTTEIDSAAIAIRKKRWEFKKKADSLNRVGWKELDKVSSTQKKEVHKFPNCSYTKVILYKLNGNGNHSGANSVFRQRTHEFKELSPSDLKDFLKLINKKSSYGNSTAACHEPRIGLVFYDENEQACSYLSLCLDCNNIYTSPELNFAEKMIPMHGFSIESRKKLHKIFEEWGFPDENFSPLFDDEALYREFLLDQEYTQEEIEEAIDQFKKDYQEEKE